MHYNGENIYIFIDGLEKYKFKAKDSEINYVWVNKLCFYVLKYFPADNIKLTGLCEYSYDFSVHYDRIGVRNILDIHKHLMVRNKIK